VNKLWLEEAWRDYLKWHDADHRLWERINELIKEIERDPFSGTGRPHPLKWDKRGYWSRRVSQEDRLVYQLEGGVLIIAECCGHYD